jgi:hypothetical protein
MKIIAAIETAARTHESAFGKRSFKVIPLRDDSTGRYIGRIAEVD